MLFHQQNLKQKLDIPQRQCCLLSCLLARKVVERLVKVETQRSTESEYRENSMYAKGYFFNNREADGNKTTAVIITFSSSRLQIFSAFSFVH